MLTGLTPSAMHQMPISIGVAAAGLAASSLRTLVAKPRLVPAHAFGGTHIPNRSRRPFC